MELAVCIGLCLPCFLVPFVVWLCTREEYNLHVRKTNLMLIERMPIRVDQKARILLKLMTEQIYVKRNPNLWETKYNNDDAETYQEKRTKRAEIYKKVKENKKIKQDTAVVIEAKNKNMNFTTINKV